MPQLHRPAILLLTAIALGVCADLLFYGRGPGFSVPLFVALLLAALAALGRSEDRPATPANSWLGAAALLFAGFVAIRTSPTLSFFNFCAALAALLLLAAARRAAPLHRLEGWRVGAGAALAAFECALLPAPLALSQASRLGQGARPARSLIVAGRGLALAAPVLLVFTGLLTMADSIFASYVSDLLNLPFDFEQIVGHALLIGIVAWLAAGGLLLALREAPAGSLLGPQSGDLPAEGETQRLRKPAVSLRVLGVGEALTVLGLTDALFAAFVAVQGAYLFGGRDTLARTGMTYSEYARRGFFELVTVACLALAMLWLLATLTRREAPVGRRAFVGACALMVALVLAMLGSAFYRMWLYESAYGFTELRLYTHSFMIWLALALLLFLAGLVRERPSLFSLGAPAAAALALLILNLANPDALIVRQNLARYQATGDLDSYYLTQLSADAAPALAAALPALSAEHRAIIGEHLDFEGQVIADRLAEDGWPAWHWAYIQHPALRGP